MFYLSKEPIMFHFALCTEVPQFNYQIIRQLSTLNKITIQNYFIAKVDVLPINIVSKI